MKYTVQVLDIPEDFSGSGKRVTSKVLAVYDIEANSLEEARIRGAERYRAEGNKTPAVVYGKAKPA